MYKQALQKDTIDLIKEPVVEGFLLDWLNSFLTVEWQERLMAWRLEVNL